MAFADGKFVPAMGSSLGMDNSADGGKLWCYYEAAAIAVIQAANYFDGAYDELSVGDFILAGGNDAALGARVGCVQAKTAPSTIVVTWSGTVPT